jgi:gamma-butyrobetaine dioxygenase
MQAEDNQLKLVWSDGHESDYDINWLLERSFAENVRKEWLNQHYPMKRISWDTAAFNKILKKYDFHDILKRSVHSHATAQDCILINAIQSFHILNQTWKCVLHLTDLYFITSSCFE